MSNKDGRQIGISIRHYLHFKLEYGRERGEQRDENNNSKDGQVFLYAVLSIKLCVYVFMYLYTHFHFVQGVLSRMYERAKETK